MADLNKLVEELSALTILEAAELKTLLEEKWGVTAATGGGMMMMAGAMPGAAAAPAEEVEEQTEFDLILEDAGPKKIEVIKVVRALTNLGLKEAKDSVEQTPTTVLEGKDKATVEDAKKKLEEVGAKVKVK